jgi:exopolysaccharide biosynthesis polyprenyl glycosylphosphotransferase
MLAVADTLAAAGASASLLVSPAAGLEDAFWAFVLVPIWVLLARLQGLYERDDHALRHLTVDEIPAVFTWALTAAGAVAVTLLLTPAGSLHIVAVLQLWFLAATAALALRAGARSAWWRATPPDEALVIGDGPLADAIRRKLELFPDIHTRVAGQLNAADELIDNPGLLDGVDRIVFISTEAGIKHLEDVLALTRPRGVKLITVLPPFSGFGSGVHLHHVADLPVFTYESGRAGRASSTLKRGLDVALASTALLLLSLFLALIALAVRLGSRGPVLFRQDRAGLDGHPFTMLKFRTMIGRGDSEGVTPWPSTHKPVVKVRPNDPRITRIGRLLRRTSLDELPQLWNVLRGEMSLVGPRPELSGLVAGWPPEHRVRLSVKPGLTGPMQVYGRSDLTFEEWLAVEREYIENPSLWRDLRILALTIPVAVTGRGAF